MPKSDALTFRPIGYEQAKATTTVSGTFGSSAVGTVISIFMPAPKPIKFETPSNTK